MTRSVRRRAWRRYRFARALVPVVSAYSDKLYERWRAADMPDGCSWFPTLPHPSETVWTGPADHPGRGGLPLWAGSEPQEPDDDRPVSAPPTIGTWGEETADDQGRQQ